MADHGMNKRRPMTTSTPGVKPTILPESIDAAPDVVRTPAGRILETHRRCPLCWARGQGYGTAYSTAPNGRTYYKCDQSMTDQPPCGHTWSVVIQETSVVVTYRTVELDGMR